ncbi:universal stress protein [Enterococcus xiangfangensis]|uniref:Universal stress protein n=1 Tax=Enterococcus xiangfangensis TaxID=1296537 RepID=A0ABU3F8F4_9ENTE|nr:universal stress protein [Enterococcus xiangfangensis]MBM7711011.1 nucleotide-binding universal stress UspA family protein [Enterococcus xiangfangensis]MDT2758949.1 universal stress protein [Enterococcus xiangfangensis]NBK07812.1 universal stress protein [Enterococcus asini]
MVDEYKNILVAVDGSAKSKKAFDEAINIAKRNKGKLTLATVIDTASFSGTTGGNSLPLMQEAREKAQQSIAELEQHRMAEEQAVHLTSQILAGNPKREIVELAKELETDLIVMGSTGLGALSLLLVGSTTAYVVNQAPCNVMVVK